jgi:hypothetical protein
LHRKLLFFIYLTVAAAPAQAQCRMAAAGACVSVPIKKSLPPVTIGEVIQKGKYSMVMDARWYGLPPAQDGWVYFRIERDVYRVDYITMTVLERATAETGRNWP